MPLMLIDIAMRDAAACFAMPSDIRRRRHDYCADAAFRRYEGRYAADISMMITLILR